MACYKTLVDSFLDVDPRLGDITLFNGFAVADHMLHRLREKGYFFGPLLKKKLDRAGLQNVHEERLHAFQTSGYWGVWTECSDFHQ
jgi:hypothetical protein